MQTSVLTFTARVPLVPGSPDCDVFFVRAILNLCFLLFAPQNQAEAHYKGHKHARKLKAMEAQKNRHRRSGEASNMGRDRDRDRDKERERDRSKTSSSETTLPALMDASVEEGTGLYNRK